MVATFQIRSKLGLGGNICVRYTEKRERIKHCLINQLS